MSKLKGCLITDMENLQQEYYILKIINSRTNNNIKDKEWGYEYDNWFLSI